MRKKTAVVVSIVGLALALASTAQAQKKPDLTSRSSEGRGTATSDDNIKTAAGANDKASVIPAPPGKGGAPATRGTGQGTCTLMVDNRTGLWIDLYTDGNYRGQVSPYGDMVGYVGCGSTTFYARAPFSDGSYRFWGPSRGYVSGPFRWTIYP